MIVNCHPPDVSDIPPSYPCMKTMNIEIAYQSTAIVPKTTASTSNKSIVSSYSNPHKME